MRGFRLAALTAIVLYAFASETPSARDLDGRRVQPVGSKGASVLVFTRTDCPISNKYAPELKQIFVSVPAGGVRFYLVYVDPSASPQQIRSHMAEYGYSIPAVIDSRRELVRASGAHVTPEAAVFLDGELVYRGRIDDRYPELGKARPQPLTHDLRDVLQVIASGKKPTLRTTKAVGCAIEDAGPPTFAGSVAGIIYSNCTPCHRPGEAAPFPLTSYEEVRAHAKQIAIVTATRIMPPWKPAPGRGEFVGERRLSDAEIRSLQEWAEAGAPPGDMVRTTGLPSSSDGGTLGKPDLIVTPETPYQLAASGPDVFRNFVLKPALDRKHYVRAVEIRPGNKRVVHHANVLLDRSRQSRLRDGRDGAPGFPGMDTRIETRSFDPESHFLFWKPGTPLVEEPPDMALELEPGTDLVLNMHLQPSGKPEEIRPSIALYFTDQQPTKRPMLIQLEHDGALDIPAGRKDFVVTDSLRLPVDVDVLGIYPHAHYLGRDIQAKATLPDGSEKWLIHIPDWDINWQAVYRYRTPVSLPKGTLITMRMTYDNSAANPRNPHQPPKRVVNGDRSDDEMAHVWLQVLPRTDARMALQKAVLARRLQKYPSDFYAEFSLGALAQSEKKPAEAVGWYRRALTRSPNDASTHNALGAALLELGEEDRALAEFEAAVRLDGEAGDAHYNAARILLRRDRVPEAVAHLRESVRIDPQDASAVSDLGAALCMTDRNDEGTGLLRRAVELQPDLYNARFNLGQALAAAGRKTEAEREFREALRVKAGDEDATEALRALRAR